MELLKTVKEQVGELFDVLIQAAQIAGQKDTVSLLSEKKESVMLAINTPYAEPAGIAVAFERERSANQEWIEKTSFVQSWMNSGKLPAKYLGWHRADILRDLIAAANSDRDKLARAIVDAAIKTGGIEPIEQYTESQLLMALDDLVEHVGNQRAELERERSALNKEERDHELTMDDRDNYHDWADKLAQAKAENDRLTTAMRFIADNAMKGHILKCLKEDDVDLDGNYIHGEYIFVKEFAQATLRQEPTT